MKPISSIALASLVAGSALILAAFAENPANTIYHQGQTLDWGVVIYVDPDSATSGHHGLAIALEDHNEMSPWGEKQHLDARHYGLYGGVANKDKIYNEQENQNNAFKACADFTAGGYTDWHLPAISELMLAFSVAQQLKYEANEDSLLNSFKASYYWSSTENNGFGVSCPPNQCGSNPTNYALVFNFTTGTQRDLTKDFTLPVRCIRAF
jgi:hypothetical protein